MANGNVTLTNGKGATKNIGAEAFRLISKGTGIARIRNEDWWLEGEEKPEVILKPRPGAKIPEKKQHIPQKPASNFVPQELVSLSEARELREKVKDLQGEIETLTAENLQLRIKLEQAEKPEAKTPAAPAASAEPAANASGANASGGPAKNTGKEEKLGPDGKPEKSKP